jgi:hypothetical protein
MAVAAAAILKKSGKKLKIVAAKTLAVYNKEDDVLELLQQMI